MGLPCIGSTELSSPVRKERVLPEVICGLSRKPSRREQDLPSLGYKAGRQRGSQLQPQGLRTQSEKQMHHQMHHLQEATLLQELRSYPPLTPLSASRIPGAVTHPRTFSSFDKMLDPAFA